MCLRSLFDGKSCETGTGALLKRRCFFACSARCLSEDYQISLVCYFGKTVGGVFWFCFVF